MSILRPMVLIAACSCVVGADWPHIRGPHYDGVSRDEGLADKWNDGGPPRLWLRELGQGHSAFVVAEDKVFTQYQSLGGQFLVCMDPETGRSLWEQRYDWSWQPRGPYPGPYASPTYARGKLFVASPTGLVTCVESRTGSTVWSVSLKERFAGKGWDFGYAATPLVEEDKVILPVGGPGAGLAALHVGDGRTVWTSEGNDPASYCPALPIDLGGRRLIVGYLQNVLVFVDMRTGKLVHRQTLSRDYDEHSAWPVYREPNLFLASPFRVSAQMLRLNADDSGAIEAKTIWSNRDFCNDVVSSVAQGDCIFGFDLRQLQSSPHRSSRGLFRCLDWATGKVRWSTDKVGQAAVLVADGKLILLEDTGRLVLARTDPSEYQELGQTQLFEDAICWTPPTLWRGKLFVRGGTRAMCLLVGKQATQSADSAQPSEAARRFDPLWLLGRERDYPNDAPSMDEMVVWFSASLAIFLAAALVAWIAYLLVAKLPAATMGWLLVFVLGLVAPALLAKWWDRCVFTWPVSLYAAFHLTLRTKQWAQRPSHGEWDNWLARGALFELVLVSFGYFELCKSVGMFVAWSFLFGFPFAAPLTMLATRAEARSKAFWQSAAWTILGFATFFWSVQALLHWKTVAS